MTRGGMGWSDFFFGEICEEINRNFRNFVRKFLFFFLQLQASLITANEECLGKKGFKIK